MLLQNEQSLLLRGVLLNLPVSRASRWLLICTFVPYLVILFHIVSRYPSIQNLLLKDIYVSNLLKLFTVLNQFILIFFFFHKGKTGETKCSLSLSLFTLLSNSHWQDSHIEIEIVINITFILPCKWRIALCVLHKTLTDKSYTISSLQKHKSCFLAWLLEIQLFNTRNELW